MLVNKKIVISPSHITRLINATRQSNFRSLLAVITCYAPVVPVLERIFICEAVARDVKWQWVTSEPDADSATRLESFYKIINPRTTKMISCH